MVPLINNSSQDKKFFEFHLASHIISLEYQLLGDNGIALICAKASKYYRYGDAMDALIHRSLEYIEKAELKVVVRCPLVMEFMGRNPQYHRLLKEDMANYYHYLGVQMPMHIKTDGVKNT